MNQCFGCGSGLDPDSFRSVHPYPDLDSESGSKKDPQKSKIGKKFHVVKNWMFSFEGGRLFCSLDVFSGVLGISKLKFLIKKTFFV